MSIKKDDLDKFFSHINDSLFTYENQDFPSYFRNSYLAGDIIQYQKNISETKIFDDEWIVTLESYFPSIDKITRNPKTFIKYDEEVVDIERAKKINAKSVRHLASHTQYIRDVVDDEVTPSKILTTFSDTDYDTYENRFLATLIQRMFLFVRNRLEVIRANVESFQKDHFKINSKFEIAESYVEMQLDVSVKRDLDNQSINEHNLNLLARVEKLAMLIDGLKGSQFMQIMKKSKPVRPPIMKTNIILKNADFRNAYTLWLFMDRYSTLGYDVSIGEKDLELDKKFTNYIDELMLVNFTTILANQIQRQRKYDATEYETYLKKRRKTAKKDFDKIGADDSKDSFQIEDNTLNEYFLNKYKKIFEKTVEEMEQDGEVRHDDAIRRAIRGATDIVNGIFEGVFKLEEEHDIFRKLVEKDNVNKDYEIKKNQLKYAKIIREVKEVDYNKAVRLEKRLIKELEKINTQFIKEKMAEKSKESKARLIAPIEAEIKKLKTENENYKKQIAALNDLETLKNQEKEQLELIRKEATERAKVELKKFDEKLKVEEKKEKEKFRKLLKEEQKILEKNQAAFEKAKLESIDNTVKLLEEEHQAVLDEFNLEAEKLKNCYHERLELEKEYELLQLAYAQKALKEQEEKHAIELEELIRREHQKDLEIARETEKTKQEIEFEEKLIEEKKKQLAKLHEDYEEKLRLDKEILFNRLSKDYLERLEKEKELLKTKYDLQKELEMNKFIEEEKEKLQNSYEDELIRYTNEVQDEFNKQIQVELNYYNEQLNSVEVEEVKPQEEAIPQEEASLLVVVEEKPKKTTTKKTTTKKPTTKKPTTKKPTTKKTTAKPKTEIDPELAKAKKEEAKKKRDELKRLEKQQLEDDAQKERERLAALKVRAYERRVERESGIKKVDEEE